MNKKERAKEIPRVIVPQGAQNASHLISGLAVKQYAKH